MKIPITFRQWLAGFFDAEGCVSTCRRSQDRFGIMIAIGQRKPAVLCYIQHIVSVGCVRKTTRGGHRFRERSKENTIFLINLMLPFSLVKRYGEDSWELDALSPQVMVDLIKENVDRLTNKAKRQRRIKLQEEQKAELQAELEHTANDWEGS